MKEKGNLILFTGDSITDGLRYKKKSQEWDLNHQMGHSYPYIINGLLGSLFPEKEFAFKNRGISGNRIVDVYARINTDLIDIAPDILSVLVGVNDGPLDINGFRPTDPDKYETLYRLLLQEVKAALPECQIILMEPFVCQAGKLQEAEEFAPWRECVTAYGAKVKKLAEEFGTLFLPLQDKFDKRCAKGNPEYWCWDGIHPTENGHGLIATEWLKAMKGVLRLE